MNRYKKGADFERKIVNAFRKMGCTALRSAGSHSPVDIVVIQDKEILLIQCKKGKLSKPAKEKAKNLMPVQFPKEFMVVSAIWTDDGPEIIMNGKTESFKGIGRQITENENK
jgi:Holliday junction resolvase